MTRRAATLLCAWCVFVTCVAAGGGGAGPGQEATPAPQDVRLAGDSGAGTALPLSHTAFLAHTVTPDANLSVQVPRKAALGHHAPGAEWQGVTEALVQGSPPSTKDAAPPPDVSPQRATGTVGQDTDHHLDKTVQLSDSVPDELKAVLPSSTVGVPLPRVSEFNKGASEDETQGVTKPSTPLRRPSASGLSYPRTTGARAEHRKLQDVGKAMQGSTEGLCDNYPGMFITNMSDIRLPEHCHFK